MQHYMSNVSLHRAHVCGCILRLPLNTTFLTRPHSDWTCDLWLAHSSETAGDMQIDIVPDHLTVLCISAHVLELEDKIDLVLKPVTRLLFRPGFRYPGRPTWCTRCSSFISLSSIQGSSKLSAVDHMIHGIFILK